MKITNTLLFLLIIGLQNLFGQHQDLKEFKGEVVADGFPVDSIKVKNSKSALIVFSDKNGRFSIPAMTGDKLLIFADHIDHVIHVVSENDLKDSLVVIKLKSNGTLLKTVKVGSNISAEGLGIVKNVKRYTQAERHLYTAQSSNFDEILNALNGRTKRIKKEIQAEKQSMGFVKLQYLVPLSYYTEKLSMPSENIKAFQYYCVEDPAFIRNLESNNKPMCVFLLGELAQKYLKLLKDEN